MTDTLMIGVSGVRGIVDKDLTANHHPLSIRPLGQGAETARRGGPRFPAIGAALRPLRKASSPPGAR